MFIYLYDKYNTYFLRWNEFRLIDQPLHEFGLHSVPKDFQYELAYTIAALQCSEHSLTKKSTILSMQILNETDTELTISINYLENTKTYFKVGWLVGWMVFYGTSTQDRSICVHLPGGISGFGVWG